jgi:hypothetical protein
MIAKKIPIIEGIKKELSKCVKRTNYNVRANSSLEIYTPAAYILVIFSNFGSGLKIFMGVGYGGASTRHKISQVVGDASSISVEPRSDDLGVIINNNSTYAFNVRVINLYD